MNTRLIAISLLLLAGLICRAQTALEPKLPEITPVSPESSALFKYVEHPVSYGTGLAQIEIPLFEIKAGSISLPIKLTYHASGIKAYESQSWVGLGWTLNAEPFVSRTIKGNPDEDAKGYLYNQKFNSGASSQYEYRLAMGETDEQPDKFYYKLAGKSGGFYFKRKYGNAYLFDVVTCPYEPVKIDYKLSAPGQMEIWDENGTYYCFGKGGMTETTGSSVTAWKATEMIAPQTKDTIFFSYDYRIVPGYKKAFRHDKITVEDRPNDVVAWKSRITYYKGGNSTAYSMITDFMGGTYGNVPTHYADGSIINLSKGETTVSSNPPVAYPDGKEQQIRQIRFGNGSVQFDKTGSGELKSIRIFNKTGLIRQIDIFQQYNMLDSLHVKDAEGAVVERYHFGYNTKNLYFLQLAQDHWGYKTEFSMQDETVVAAGYMPVTFFDGDRRYTYWTNTGGVQKTGGAGTYGMLTSITYPTGGRTEFTYESHQYRDKDPYYGYETLMKAGGVRIREIADIEPMRGKKVIRRFFYGRPNGLQEFDGVGFVKRKVRLEDYMIEQDVYYYNDPQTTKLRTYYADPVFTASFYAGSPVVYDVVTEFKIAYEQGQETNLGKTVYRYMYSDSSEGTDMRIPGTPIYTDPRVDWRYGQLKSKEEYRNENGNYVLVSRRSSDYGIFKASKLPVAEAFRKRVLVNYGYSGYSLMEDIKYQTYDIEIGCVRLVSDTTIVIENGRELTTIKEYSYDNNILMFPTKVETKYDEQTLEKTKTESYKYLHDILSDSTSEPVYQALLNQWKISTMLESRLSEATEATTIYTYAGYKSFEAGILPENIRMKKEGFPEETRVVFHQYDKRSNLVYATQDNTRVIYLWGYNSRYVIAEIKNVSYTEVTGLIPEITLNAISAKNAPSASDLVMINNLRTSLPNAWVSTYTWKPLTGVETITSPAGITLYHDYDPFGRLIKIYRKKADGSKEIVEAYEYHYQPK